ncbi:S-layer homology domain-containing protein [Agathobaculum sp.]|uniref:S-layer homology domain-containing protein n=1 Tax=Agathobaculum sp. TaxID=2048138 RepID=UPI003AB7CC61
MKKKQTLALLLAGAMLVPNAFAASPEDFHDFPTDWSAAGLRRAVDNGLLNGANGRIDGSGLLTRAQMAAIINRAFAAKKTADLSGYNDVSADAWYRSDLAAAVAMGTFQGANGQLNPERPITREEAFTVLARAFAHESGSTASLNVFSDSASVSSWAADSAAALVENGYVNGANGALNPKSNITRAEFAKIISDMASTYADASASLPETVDGSLIVRDNSVSLAGKTINGDLIIADGVSQIDLSNVTVTGRILLRGGESGVNFANTKAGKGIVANTDIAVSGTVDSITVIADGAKISGSGKVGAVQANANNVSVSTTGTKVSAAAGVSGVKAGSKAVDAGKTETVSTSTSGGASGGSSSGGSSSGGSSSGGSSSGGSSSGGSTSGGSQVTQAAIADAQVVSTDTGAYLALSFKDGFTLGGTTVTVDGADVKNAVSKVTDDGAVAKIPLVAQPGSVTLTSGAKTQTISLGTAEEGAVYTGEDYLPDYFIKHGPLDLWDYYLTNYDNAGNVRVLPSKTTFGTSAVRSEHPSYSEPLVLNENGEGSVVVMFNYTSEADKAWFDNIASYDASSSEGAVQLVAYDQYKNTWNRNLKFEKGTAEHNGSTVATLTIPFNQDNFRSNGRYYVRVTSANAQGVKSSALASIHVQNYATPELKVKETPQSGVNLHFAVSNLVYGIVDPIEKVTLTDPTGATKTLEKIKDYYLISQDLFVLYNDVSATDGRNNLPYKGEYTLTIEANGFKKFSKSFTVAEGEQPAKQTAITYDAISRATGSTSGGSSSDGSSGGYAISTDFLFDSDLVANANVLDKLNKSTADSTAVLEYWKYNASTLDSVFDKGDVKYFSGTDYTDYVSTDRNGKLWKSYADFKSSHEASVFPPHATKAILEDGLLGDIQDSTASGKLDYIAPAVSENKQGKDVVLTFANGEDYLGKVSALYLNGDWRELGEKYYTIDGNAITLKKDLLHVGENALKIESAGYKPQTVKFAYNKVNETGLSLSVADTAAGEPVVITVENSNGDFLSHLKSVTLTSNGKDDAVYRQGVEGSDAVYYEIAEDNKSLTLHNVKPGTYTVKIAAEYYDDALTKEFTMDGTVEVKAVPEMKVTSSEKDGVFTVSIQGIKDEANNTTTDRQIDEWKSKVQTISVQNTQYDKIADFSFAAPSKTSTDYELKTGTYGGYELVLGGGAFKDGENTVVISADGYEDKKITVTKEKTTEPTEPTKPEKPSEGEVKVPTTAPTLEKLSNLSGNTYYSLVFKESDKVWVSKVSGITVSGQSYKTVTSVDDMSTGNYLINSENGSIALLWSSLANYPFEIVLSTENNGTLTLIAEQASYFSDPTVSLKNNGTSGGNSDSESPLDAVVESCTLQDSLFGKYYQIKFSNPSGTELTNVLNSIASVTVGSETYTKASNATEDNTFSLSVAEGWTATAFDRLNLAANGFSDTSDTTITITTSDNKTLTFTVDKNGNLKA